MKSRSTLPFAGLPTPTDPRLPLLTEAKFILVVNMLAAFDAVIIAALAICVVDRILELKDGLR
jgi:hypothetical protein